MAINGDGTVTYTPNADFNGTDSFTYTVTDGDGGTRHGDGDRHGNPVNDAPVANDDSATADEDTPVTTTVLANDTLSATTPADGDRGERRRATAR